MGALVNWWVNLGWAGALITVALLYVLVVGAWLLRVAYKDRVVSK